MENIPTPNKKIIEEYLINWDNLEEHYIWQESSLDKLFHKDYKNNTDLKIDKRLKNGDPSLVNDIAHVTISGKEKVFYSFASKYCSHHNNNEFPIYDYFVDRMLMHFKNKDNFAKFTKEDLKAYVKFKNILIQFKKNYKIDEYNLRDIDKYLWIAGKEYFPKKY